MTQPLSGNYAIVFTLGTRRTTCHKTFWWMYQHFWSSALSLLGKKFHKSNFSTFFGTVKCRIFKASGGFATWNSPGLCPGPNDLRSLHIVPFAEFPVPKQNPVFHNNPHQIFYHLHPVLGRTGVGSLQAAPLRKKFTGLVTQGCTEIFMSSGLVALPPSSIREDKLADCIDYMENIAEAPEEFVSDQQHLRLSASSRI